LALFVDENIGWRTERVHQSADSAWGELERRPLRFLNLFGEVPSDDVIQKILEDPNAEERVIAIIKTVAAKGVRPRPILARVFAKPVEE